MKPLRTKKGDARKLQFKRQLRAQLTPAENRLWLRLRSKQFENLKFRRQHGIGPYIVDFFCPERKIAIEVDGDVHALDAQIVHDTIREEYLKNFDIRTIRYNNNDILGNLEGVLEDLLQKINE